MASSPTIKEPTGSTAGGAQRWGGPDAVHAAELFKGTHSTEKIQSEAIDRLGKAKDDATVAPDNDNDNTEGYSIGSRWFDITADKAYVALDVSTGAAVWIETTQTGGGETNPALISQAEAETGTDTGERVISGLRLRQGAEASRKEVQIIVSAFDADAVVENDVGDILFNIGPLLAGMNLVSAEAVVATAGTTGTLDIMIRNKTQAADMLSAVIQVASAAILSDNGETINTAEDDVILNDQIAVDIDVIHSGTASKGLTIILGFEKP